MNLQTLRKLYVNQLRDIYNSENQIVAALPQMAAAAKHPELKKAFKQHTAETKEQINRLERIFQSMGQDPSGKTCEATLGLIKEGQEVLSAKGDDDVIDAGLIGAAQKIEHYEIANYGTVVTYAKMLGENQAANLLQTTLDEEKRTDKKLTVLAKTNVNTDALEAYPSESYSESDSGGLSFLSLLLGAAAGVAAGMLLAPGPGTDTRRKLTDTTNSWKNQLTDTLGNLKGGAKSGQGKSGSSATTASTTSYNQEAGI